MCVLSFIIIKYRYMICADMLVFTKAKERGSVDDGDDGA